MLNLFVACPYSPQPCDDYRDVFRKLETFFPYVKFHFADERIDSDVILARVVRHIKESSFCLCDITGWNPNVTLELGLALGMGKRAQLLFCKRRRMFGWSRLPDLDLPADIRGHARINYDDANSLHASLRALIQQEIANPDGNTAPGSFKAICENVFGLVVREPGLKSVEIARRLGMETAHIKPALDHLIDDDRIYKIGRYGNAVYYQHGYTPSVVPAATSQGEVEPPSHPRSEKQE